MSRDSQTPRPAVLSTDMELLYGALSTGVQIPMITVRPAVSETKTAEPLQFTTRFSPSELVWNEAPAGFTALHQFRTRFSLFRTHFTTAVTHYLTDHSSQKEATNVQASKQYTVWTQRNNYLDEAEDIPEWVAKANSLLGTQITSVDEAYDRAENLFPVARFIVDPGRFERQAMQPPAKKENVQWPLGLEKLRDVGYEHELHKRNTVWRLDDIRTFLRMFFKFPKKFKEIGQHLPHKTPGELIQFYYLLKMPFRLKKRLRRQAIQFRRSKSNLEQLIETHVDKILNQVQTLTSRLPSVQRQSALGLSCAFLSMEELTAVSQEMCREDRQDAPRREDAVVMQKAVEFYWEPKDLTPVELEVMQVDYRKRYGKGSSDYKEYARYKEYAYGGEKIQDEGPGEQTRQWTYAQKKQFLKQFQILGKNWEALATVLESKTPSQVKAFYDTYRKKLNLDALEPRNTNSA